MPVSADPDHFFQTSHSLAETNRKALKSKNKHGNPIQLPSKILAIIIDPLSSRDAVYIAESAGNVRRVAIDVGSEDSSHLRIQTGEKDLIYRGPAAPVTSLATSLDGTTLIGGCWDKTIWSWSVSNGQSLLRYRGHTDFVKCLVALELAGTEVVISGAADASIIVWNLHSAEKIHVLKGHTRGILDLAIDPSTYVIEEAGKIKCKEVVIFSAGSDREIRRWRVGLETAKQIEAETPILVHATSVYALRFDADGDLWTASADGTVKRLSRDQDFYPDTNIEHGDYVRAVALEEVRGYVVTAGRSEGIKVWDRGSEDLVHVFSGHFEEVTGLVTMGQRCVSVSIDATVRTWSLRPEDIRLRKEGEQKALAVGESVPEGQPTNEGTTGGLTAEEARDLEELMQDE